MGIRASNEVGLGFLLSRVPCCGGNLIKVADMNDLSTEHQRKQEERYYQFLLALCYQLVPPEEAAQRAADYLKWGEKIFKEMTE